MFGCFASSPTDHRCLYIATNTKKPTQFTFRLFHGTEPWPRCHHRNAFVQMRVSETVASADPTEDVLHCEATAKAKLTSNTHPATRTHTQTHYTQQISNNTFCLRGNPSFSDKNYLCSQRTASLNRRQRTQMQNIINGGNGNIKSFFVCL